MQPLKISDATIDFGNSPFSEQNKEEFLSLTESSAQNDQNGGFWFLKSDSDNDPKILKALKEKKYEAVEFMILNDMMSDYGTIDSEGSTLLHYLISNYSETCVPSIVDHLLERSDIKKFINKQDKDGNTPLVLAVKFENMELADKLIGAGAKGDIPNNDGIGVVATEGESPKKHFKDTLEESEDANLMKQRIIDLLLSKYKKTWDTIDQSKQQETEIAPEARRLFTSEETSESNEVVDVEYRSSNGVEDVTTRDTEQFLKILTAAYFTDASPQVGGERNVRIGKRTLNLYKESGGKKSKKTKKMKRPKVEEMELSRMIKNKVTEIHVRVVEQIMSLMKMSEDDAKFVKAYIYKYVKEKFPSLKGIDRAKEMEKLATKKFISEIESKELTKLKKDIQKHYDSKEKDEKEKKSDASDSPLPSLSTTSDEKVIKIRATKKVKRLDIQDMSTTSVSSAISFD
jgi:hypothetical protein